MVQLAPDVPPVFSALEAWILSNQSALDGEQTRRLQDLSRLYRERVLVGARIPLPGPTGEDNTLYFAPRGPALLMADCEADVLHQMLAAFACNADVVMLDSPLCNGLIARLPRAVTFRITRVACIDEARFAVVLHHGPAQQARALRESLSQQAGPIIPVLEAAPVFDSSRLIVERCVTVNTAAAGGNAALATLRG